MPCSRSAIGSGRAEGTARSAIRDEVRRLAADDVDRVAMREIREQMADRAPRPSDRVVRGELFRLPAPRGARGRGQRGVRYAVVVQADEFLDLSTTLVAPTPLDAEQLRAVDDALGLILGL